MENNRTKRDIISEIRGLYKLHNEDGFVTDRFLYSIFKKYGEVLIRRKFNEKKLMKGDSAFQWLPVVQLIDVDKIEADCLGIKTNCTYKRTRFKLPKMLQVDKGSLIKLVFSVDTSEKVEQTTLLKFHEMTKSTNFKYNKIKYFWEKEGYLYLPNVNWSAITLQACFEENVTGYCLETEELTDCKECNQLVKPKCTYIQDDFIPFSDDLVADILGMVRQDLVGNMQIPSDTSDNNQNIMR